MCPNSSDQYPDDVFFQQSLLSLKQIHDEEQVGLAVIDNHFRFIFVMMNCIIQPFVERTAPGEDSYGDRVTPC